MARAGGLILAAPASGSGKTTLTLGLLRQLRRRGIRAVGAKAGPDYIDPGFHEAASDQASINLDPWAMRPGLIHRLVEDMGAAADIVLCEGVMGLFDGAGASADKGSTADLAAFTGWPVILVVDVQGQSASVAALVDGFAGHRRDVHIAGLILNRVGSPRHETMLRNALSRSSIPVLGCVARDETIRVPSRHLGLVQACERPDLADFLDRAADLVSGAIDIDRLLALAAPARGGQAEAASPPLGQRIAVARDDAFRFAYAHTLAGWRGQGAEIAWFSPLADEAPWADADAIFLPGGYPELHAGTIAGAGTFRDGMRRAAKRGTLIHGECGGYMVLGRILSDAGGIPHAMLGLLPVSTSMAQARRRLGYRQALGLTGPWARQAWRGHEFHFARMLDLPGDAAPDLWRISDADGVDLGMIGHRQGSVSGAFLHLIDRAD